MALGSQTTTTTDGIMTTGTLKDWLASERLQGRPRRTGDSYPSGTLWPHGEWSLGYAQRRPDGGEWHEDPYTGLGVDDTDAARQAAREALADLDLSDAPNSHRPPRGLNGITGYGQQMVKACGFIMGDKFPHHRKTLGTITLPPMPPEVRSAVAADWPELTRRLLQWLTRRLERQGLPPIACSVTEVQPKRLATQSEAYLHWHLLWLNHPGKAGNWAVDPCDVRAWLQSTLERRIPGYPGGHVNVDVKPVKGEAARYLAKYMSKGRQQVAEALKDWGEGLCPRTWWNLTKAARDAVKAATHKGETAGAYLDRILTLSWRGDLGQVHAFLRHIEMEFDGVNYTVGWRGRFVPSVHRALTSMLDSLNSQQV